MGLSERLADRYRRRREESRRRQEQERWKLLERPLWRTMAVPVVGVLVLSLVLLLPSYQGVRRDDRAAAVLAHDGLDAAATAIGIRTYAGQASIAIPDSVRVRFTTASGETVTRWLPTSHLPEQGQVVQVRYAPSDPTVVRIAGDEHPYAEPFRSTFVLCAATLLVGVTAVAVYRWAMRRYYDLD